MRSKEQYINIFWKNHFVFLASWMLTLHYTYFDVYLNWMFWEKSIAVRSCKSKTVPKSLLPYLEYLHYEAQRSIEIYSDVYSNKNVCFEIFICISLVVTHSDCVIPKKGNVFFSSIGFHDVIFCIKLILPVCGKYWFAMYKNRWHHSLLYQVQYYHS